MTAGGDMPSRRLAAIMFTDLVGYSALAHRNEKLAIELLELHRTWIREILPKHGGIEIETVGDAFLVEFAGALAAVECAIAIHQRFSELSQSAPEDRRMQLRIGIHLGDVEHKDGKVMGDGVNVASRIHGVAEPGGICVSDPVLQVVHGHGFSFESVGSPALKNIDTRLRLYAVGAAPHAGTARVVATLRRKRRLLAALAVVATLAAIGAGAWRSGLLLSTPVLDKSVAVLPFENLSAEPNSSHFTDGLHDSVIGHLSRIKGLKVISRTSVLEYRDQKRDIRSIAKALKVASVVEGSVQRVGGRLRVTVQLIEASTDTHLWSEEYERELADVFAVQADIARQIARSVRAELTPEVRRRLEVLPTQDMAAYELYLKAAHVQMMVLPEREQTEQAISWLDEAVRRDPGFAKAYALLAETHDNMFWRGYDPTQERVALMREAAERALHLDADLPDAQLAWALYLYHGRGELKEAARVFQVMLEAAPGDADAQHLLGWILARLGRNDESLDRLRIASELDPRDRAMAFWYGYALVGNKRYAEAQAVMHRALTLASDPLDTHAVLASLAIFWKGDLEPARRNISRALAQPHVNCGIAVDFATGQARLTGQSAAAIELLNRCRGEFPASAGAGAKPKEFLKAMLYRTMRDHHRAREEARSAVARLSRDLARLERPEGRTYLAVCLAMLGDESAARQNMKLALDSPIAASDAMVRSAITYWAMWVPLYLGRNEEALDALERALATPWTGYAYEFALDPEWKHLRGNPRFDRLMAQYVPKDEGT